MAPPDLSRVPGAVAPPAHGWLATLAAPLPARRAIPRQLDIDAARGLAIVLVVVGHVVAREMPAGNEWYAVLKALIYRFHMPLFMVLTGITFALALPHFARWSEIGAWSRGKVARLAVPYLFFGLLILAGKLLAAPYLHVDNVPRGTLAEDLLALVVRPSDGAAGFLWFIYVLALYFMTLPALLHALGRRPLPLFLASLALALVPWPRAFLLDAAFGYLPFFSAGMLLWLARERWARLSAAAGLAWGAVFVAALALALPLGLEKWQVGALSVPAVLAAMQRLPGRWRAALAAVGVLSLSIYLMNTLAIGLTKAVLLKLLPWDGVNFLLYFPLLTLAGIALPILVKRAVARRAPALDRYV